MDSLVKDGLEQALKDLTAKVRNNPADLKQRTYLFQLLSVLGQWDRALTQLHVCGDLDDMAIAMVKTYQEALTAEAFREQVFLGKRSPLVFGSPAEWIVLLIESLAARANGNLDMAMELREKAFDQAETVSGQITLGEDDTQTFEWLADADPLLGPVIEAVVNGNYYWIPMQNIHRIQFDEPEDMRDLVWMPAYFTWTNGGETVGLIPTRYAGSEKSDSDQIRLARLTDWVEGDREDDVYGLGQRMFATDQNEYALMDIRSITFNNLQVEEAPESSEDASSESD